jgi:hypothetical protein
MIGQNRATRANVALLLAILLFSVSAVSSLTRQIRFSGPPRTNFTKYVATSYEHDGQFIALANGSAEVDVPHNSFPLVFAVSDDGWKASWPSFSLHIRPPPHA